MVSVSYHSGSHLVCFHLARTVELQLIAVFFIIINFQENQTNLASIAILLNFPLETED